MKMNKSLTTSIEVRDVPEITVAYIRHVGPYAGNEGLFESLFNSYVRGRDHAACSAFPKLSL